MPARIRFATTLALLFALQLAVLSVFLLFLSLDATPAQRALLGQLLAQNAAMLAVLALMLILLLGFGLHALSAAYVAPLRRLAEEAVLLAANPRHRLEPHGAPAVRALIAKLNDLAAANQALRERAQEQIDEANRSLSDQRNRLAALMSDLALSVLVCTLDGRILLYNQRASALLGSTSRIGLGRSVFGVLGREQAEHAMEQLRHQLDDSAADAGDPVAAFVATLAGGEVVRVQMAPVLDHARVFSGFVLTLDDITRNISAEARRDHLLQSLSRSTRSAVGNIRTAVEVMQAFPGMGGEMQARLASVIDEESQRLARDIDCVEELNADAHDNRWGLEAMRGADLVALLLRRAGDRLVRVSSGTVDAGLWLNVDSYALTHVLDGLAGRLAMEAGVSEVRLELQRAGRLACLTLTWEGAALPSENVRCWEQQAAPADADGVRRTLEQVVAHHAGETVYRSGPGRESSYALLLPIIETRIALEAPRSAEGEAHFYDFDLFHQAGQTTELDQRPLSQLAYTVFDTETTGLQPAEGDEIISIGALRILNGRLLHRERFDRLVQPGRLPSAESVAIHGIAAAMLEGQPRIGQVLREFHHFAEDTVLVAHNAAFDMRFLQLQEARAGVAFEQPVLDTLLLSQVIHPGQPQHTLEAIAARLGVDVAGRHTALGDAVVTGSVFLAMIPLLAGKGIITLRQAREASEQTQYARLRY